MLAGGVVFLVVTARANSSRARSLVAPLHMLATSCVRLLSRSLSQRPCLGARVGVDSARAAVWLFVRSDAAGGCLFGGSASAHADLPRLVFDCLMPVPSNRRRIRGADRRLRS